MKILVLCQRFYPEQFLINDIVPALVNNGHEVTVLTGRPNYPDGKIKRGYPKSDIYQGARIVRANEIGRKKGLVLNYLSFLKSANKTIVKLGEFDIVFSYQLSPITMAAPFLKYKKKYPKTKSLLYCLDIWPESFNSHMPLAFIRNAVWRYSKRIYQSYDRIMVTSKPFLDYLHRVNEVEKDKMVYIPQHAAGNLIDKDLSSNNNVVHFMFAGNFGKGQRLDVIINALNLIDRDYVMDFVGSGSCEKSLKRLVSKMGLENRVVFHGRKTYAEMEVFYRKADALLISLRGNNEVGNTLPGKIQTYMSAGKPIFGAINGAANELIKETNSGDCVSSGDFVGLSRLLIDFIDCPQKYKHCGANARAFFSENFTLDVFMSKLEKELAELKKE